MRQSQIGEYRVHQFGSVVGGPNCDYPDGTGIIRPGYDRFDGLGEKGKLVIIGNLEVRLQMR